MRDPAIVDIPEFWPRHVRPLHQKVYCSDRSGAELNLQNQRKNMQSAPATHHHPIFPIDTVAVRPATRRRSGGTSLSLIRTGMRCARRTQLKVGFTEANSSLLVLRL